MSQANVYFQTSTGGEIAVSAANPLPVTGGGGGGGDATSANQTNGSQKTQVVDGSGNVITSSLTGGLQSLNVNVTGAPTFSTGPAVAALSGSITSTGTSNGYIFNASAYTCVTVKVTAPAAGCTIAFASSVLSSGTPGDTLFVTKQGSGALISTDTLGANATQLYEFNIIGQIQVNIYATVLSSGTITIIGNETSDSVSINQYVQAVQSGTWATQITDGTNTGNVTAANASPTNNQAAQIVALSPNNTGIPVNTAAIVQKTNNVSSGSVASLVKAFATNNIAGNTIVVVCGVGNAAIPTITDSAGNTYTAARTEANGAFLVGIFYATNILAGANTITISNGGANASIAMQIYEVSGLLQHISALDVIGYATGTSGAPNSSNASSLTANDYFFGAIGVGTAAQTVTVTPGPFGWTNDSGNLNPTTPSGLFSLVTGSAFVPTVGATSFAGTMTSEPWVAVICGFRTVTLAVGGTVNIASIASSITLSVQGAKTNNSAAPGATNIGALTVLANAAAPTWSEGDLVLSSSDLAGNSRVMLTNIGGTAVVTGGVNGSLGVGGLAANGATVAGNPIYNGAQAINAEITPVANGQAVGLVADIVGKLITMPHANKENFISGTATTTGTSDTSVIASAGGSLKNYITGGSVYNTGATTATITIKSGSGGSTIWTTLAPAGGSSNFIIDPPISTAAATAVYFAAGSSSTTVGIALTGYKGT